MAYLFDKKGVAIVDGSRWSEEDLRPAVDAGAEDIVADEDISRCSASRRCSPTSRAALIDAGVEVADPR